MDFESKELSSRRNLQFLPSLPEDVLERIFIHLLSIGSRQCKVCHRTTTPLVSVLQTLYPLLFVSKAWNYTITGFIFKLKSFDNLRWRLASHELVNLFKNPKRRLTPGLIQLISKTSCLTFPDKHVGFLSHERLCFDSVSCVFIHHPDHHLPPTDVGDFITRLNNLKWANVSAHNLFLCGPIFNHNSLQRLCVGHSRQCPSRDLSQSHLSNIFHLRGSLQSLRSFSFTGPQHALDIDKKYLPDLSSFPNLTEVSLTTDNRDLSMLSSLTSSSNLKRLRLCRLALTKDALQSILQISSLETLILHVDCEPESPSSCDVTVGLLKQTARIVNKSLQVKLILDIDIDQEEDVTFSVDDVMDVMLCEVEKCRASTGLEIVVLSNDSQRQWQWKKHGFRKI